MTELAAQIDDEVIGCLLSERDYAIRSEELASGLFATVDDARSTLTHLYPVPEDAT